MYFPATSNRMWLDNCTEASLSHDLRIEEAERAEVHSPAFGRVRDSSRSPFSELLFDSNLCLQLKAAQRLRVVSRSVSAVSVVSTSRCIAVGTFGSRRPGVEDRDRVSFSSLLARGGSGVSSQVGDNVIYGETDLLEARSAPGSGVIALCYEGDW